jgi:hypothetical protein
MGSKWVSTNDMGKQELVRLPIVVTQIYAFCRSFRISLGAVHPFHNKLTFTY